MRITLVAVGRAKAGPLRELYKDFADRLTPQGPLGALTLKEIEQRRPLAPAELKRRESDLLLAAVPPGARLIALDMRGKSLSSEAFAAQLNRWQDEGIRDLAFAIGGADGLDDSLRAAAAMSLSLGAMTWPHMLVRVMLAEQLYRAQTILTGHPYHRA